MRPKASRQPKQDYLHRTKSSIALRGAGINKRMTVIVRLDRMVGPNGSTQQPMLTSRLAQGSISAVALVEAGARSASQKTQHSPPCLEAKCAMTGHYPKGSSSELFLLRPMSNFCLNNILLLRSLVHSIPRSLAESREYWAQYKRSQELCGLSHMTAGFSQIRLTNGNDSVIKYGQTSQIRSVCFSGAWRASELGCGDVSQPEQQNTTFCSLAISMEDLHISAHQDQTDELDQQPSVRYQQITNQTLGRRTGSVNLSSRLEKVDANLILRNRSIALVHRSLAQTDMDEWIKRGSIELNCGVESIQEVTCERLTPE